MTDKDDADRLDAALEQLEADDEERRKRLTPEELDAELREEGLDPAAGRALALRVLGGATKTGPGEAGPTGAPADNVVPLRPGASKPRGRAGAWIGAGAIAASVAGAVGYAVMEAGLPNVASGFDGGPGFEEATKLHAEAWAAYRRGGLGESRAKLDRAKAIYPAGERSEDVVELRALLDAEGGRH